MILFTNGCSNTWGGGLEPHFRQNDINDNSKRLSLVWSHHLGKLLNADKVINLSAGCGSNQRTVRTTFDWFINDYKKNEPVIAVIQITDPARYEYYLTHDFSDFENDTDQWLKLTPSAHVLNNDSLIKHNFVLSEIEPKVKKERDSRMLTYTLLEGMYRTITNLSALANLFKDNSVEYHFFEKGFNMPEFYPIKYKKYFKELHFIDAIERDFKVDTVSKVDNHPSVLGHKQLADLLYQRIRPKQVSESI